jgi:hypothetical protein
MNSRIHLIRIAWGLGIAVLVVACAAQYQQREQALQQPINCATAEGDLRMLQNEKAHVAQQIAMGVTAIAPAGLVAGLITGTEQTKEQVATGDYTSRTTPDLRPA